MRNPPRPVNGYQIERSLQAWRDLVAAFDLDPALESDQDAQGRFLHASGAENPHALLGRLIDDVIALQRKSAHVDALRKRYADLRDRIQTHAEQARNTIEQLLEVLELKAWEGDEGAARMQRRPPSVLVTNLDKLPAEFVKIEKTAKKSELAPKLKAGEVIEGAELSNPGLGLTILPF